MTHTPTLPNGFSRDFSEAPEGDLLVYVALFSPPTMPLLGKWSGGRFRQAGSGLGFTRDELLCWCPIPTPGDAVLKELAEEGK